MKIEERRNLAGELTGYVVYPFLDESATFPETAAAFCFLANLSPGAHRGTIKGIHSFPVSLELAREYRNALNEAIRIAEENLPMGIVNSKEIFTVTPKGEANFLNGGGQ